MASMASYIEISDKHRPCWFIAHKHRRKAVFHRWIEEREAVAASPLEGGTPAGIVATTFAIIELENGSVWKVYPESIHFADHGEFQEFTWGDEYEQ